MNNPFSLVGKTIFVTGASSGIGRSIAIESSKLGAKIILTGRNEVRLLETCSMLDGKDHIPLLFDLNNIENLEVLVNQLPMLDGVIHSSGLVKLIPFKYTKHEDFFSLNRVNYEAVFLLTQKIFKLNRIKSPSSIVFISSIMSKVGLQGNGIYAGNKAALDSLSRCLALEFSNKKIRFNVISPGLVMTPLVENIHTENEIDDYNKSNPLGLGKPEDVAYASIYLLSDASRWITGTNLIIDGGYSAR